MRRTWYIIIKILPSRVYRVCFTIAEKFESRDDFLIFFFFRVPSETSVLCYRLCPLSRLRFPRVFGRFRHGKDALHNIMYYNYCCERRNNCDGDARIDNANPITNPKTGPTRPRRVYTLCSNAKVGRGVREMSVLKRWKRTIFPRSWNTLYTTFGARVRPRETI